MKSDLENQSDRSASRDGSPQASDREPLVSLNLSLGQNSADVALPHRRLDLPGWVKAKGWLFMTLAVCSAFGGVGAMALFWLTTPPPSANCEKISLLSPDVERLYCAQEAAKSGDLPQLLAGLKMLEEWTPEHPLYQQAQDSIATWSAGVLQVARQRIEQSDLQGALNLIAQIPQSSPVYNDAQAEVQLWTKQWDQGEAIVAKAQAAMKQQKWDESAQQIRDLRAFDHDYWRVQRANTLARQLSAEERARRMLKQVTQLAQSNHPPELGEALRQAMEITPETYAWADGRKLVQQWSQTLLLQAEQQWNRQEWDGAIATAELLLVNPEAASVAQDLIWLSQAQKFILASTSSLNPSFGQIGNLTGAIALASLVPATSPFYAQAQTRLQNWQAQLQDVNQLQMARLVAQSGQPLAYEVAIHQAQQITPDRPRRLQAQTLVAQWQKEFYLAEVRPILNFAKLLAEKGTIPFLKAAIAQVEAAKTNRVTKEQVQALVATWTRSIQVIADRPILDEAWATARGGNLAGAIQVAARIAGDRALYGEAQSAIAGWQAEIYAAERARIRQRQAEMLKRNNPARPEEERGWSESSPWPEASPEANALPEELPIEEPPSRGYSGASEPAYAPPSGPTQPTTPTPADGFPQPIDSFPQPTELTPADTFPQPSGISPGAVVIPEPPPRSARP